MIIISKAKTKRSLYQCFNARVLEKRIYCAKGHMLDVSRACKTIAAVRLARGEPLELAVCQNCPDFDEMGEPLVRAERGWH